MWCPRQDPGCLFSELEACGHFPKAICRTKDLDLILIDLSVSIDNCSDAKSLLPLYFVLENLHVLGQSGTAHAVA